jgi:DNA-binding transcriptional regulator YdaS (Cro superfamily)
LGTSGLAPNLTFLSALAIVRQRIACAAVEIQTAVLRRLSITPPDKILEVVTEATAILVAAPRRLTVSVAVDTVTRVDLRSTLIVGCDRIWRHVPNSELASSIVKTLSRRAHRRIQTKVPWVMTAAQAKHNTAARDRLRAHLHDGGDFALTERTPQYVHGGELGPIRSTSPLMR